MLNISRQMQHATTKTTSTVATSCSCKPQQSHVEFSKPTVISCILYPFPSFFSCPFLASSSHQASKLSTGTQARSAYPDARRRTHPRPRLHLPLIPHLAIIRLSPHANLEFRVCWKRERLPEREENGKPGNHVLALAVNTLGMRADLDLVPVLGAQVLIKSRCVER